MSRLDHWSSGHVGVDAAEVELDSIRRHHQITGRVDAISDNLYSPHTLAVMVANQLRQVGRRVHPVGDDALNAAEALLSALGVTPAHDLPHKRD